ncbi:uncharacterized protein J3D65DRAFT_667265 [Phyllosticta citribraziliensis]|uniref:Uncharacterized protein n=1 Tax=Phyllosticta citribraziliensis TaxID=989973 RepID=A0ABR1LVQ7_9PEZI
MPSQFVSVQDLDDPFVDSPCGTPSPEAIHRQALRQPSIQRALSALKTSFTEEDVEQIAATHRRRRRQLTAFLKNRTLLRQLDQVQDDQFDDALDADDREYLKQEGPWEIVGVKNGEQALRGRREEFKGAMVELDDDTVALGLKCQNTIKSAHASLKAIHDRSQGKYESFELDKAALQTSKFHLMSFMHMMRGTVARFCGILDDAGTEKMPVSQRVPGSDSVCVQANQVANELNVVDNPKHSATAVTTTPSTPPKQMINVAHTSSTPRSEQWEELDDSYLHETEDAVQILASDGEDTGVKTDTDKPKSALPLFKHYPETESHLDQHDDSDDEDLVFVSGVGQIE